MSEIPYWQPTDKLGARWVRAVMRRLLDIGSPAERITVRYNSDRAPIQYPSTRGEEPAGVRVLRIVRAESGDRKLRQAGNEIEWEWKGNTLEISLIDGLSSVVEYDVTLELVR